MPDANVRTHKRLGARQQGGPATAAADPDPQLIVPAGRVRTRQTASDDYHRALATHRQATPTRLADPDLAEAAERQTRATRAQPSRAPGVGERG